MPPRIYQWLAGKRLCQWYSIRIEDHEENSKKVFFLSEVHVVKEAQMPVGYVADQFTDGQILNDSDLIAQVHRRYGADILYQS